MTTSLDAIGSRLSQYLSYKRIGINKFGRLTNTSGAQISNIINGKNYGMTKLIEIIHVCPDLNMLWLLKGEGEMLVDATGETGSTDRPPVNMLSNEQQKKLNMLTEENRSLKAELEKINLKHNSLEGALTYQSMTIEAYKNSIDVLSATNRDLKDLLQLYKSSGQVNVQGGGEDLEKRNNRKSA
jgi:hypothetical protein